MTGRAALLAVAVLGVMAAPSCSFAQDELLALRFDREFMDSQRPEEQAHGREYRPDGEERGNAARLEPCGHRRAIMTRQIGEPLWFDCYVLDRRGAAVRVDGAYSITSG